MGSFAGTAGKTYWDEGIESSILALQKAAQATGHADLMKRATELQTRLTEQTFPVLSGWLIKGDTLKLGDDIAAVTGGTNPVYDLDAGIGGVYGVAPPEVEAQVGGDVVANVEAAASDVESSAGDLASAVKLADLPHQITKYGRYLLVALVALIVLYVVLRARR